MIDSQYTTPDPAPAPESAPSQKTGWKEVVREVIIFAAIALGIVLPFRTFIAEPYVVSGPSMEPTFHTGDYLIVDKFSYRNENPLRNSVVVFKFPTEGSRDLIKRIIGLPGDTVVMNGNKVTIINKDNPQGFELNQSFITNTMPGFFTVTLNADQFFVMGDNRPQSYDSRSWGVLPRSDILGRPILRLLPFNQIGWLPGDETK